MPKLYLAVYVAGRMLNGLDTADQRVRAFHAERAASSWPYDAGDDPSFFFAQKTDGMPVTWGVCRPDARRRVQPGDWVAFIAVQYNSDRSRAEYRLASALCVRAKVCQTDIFSPTAELELQAYPNTLVRPCGAGWQHFEPVLPANEWHRDWLWRICSPSRMRKDEFLTAGDMHNSGQQLLVGTQPAPVDPNYVVFGTGRHDGFVLSNPPVIATWTKGQSEEQWLTDPATSRIRQLTLVESGRGRSLRIKNSQPHRHVVGELKRAPSEWIAELQQAALEMRSNSDVAADEALGRCAPSGSRS